jgi:hypothetical protein
MSDTPATNELHLWTSPPGTVVPLTRSPFRVAIGTPGGLSSNSWRIWTAGRDAYIACRDNFREFKVSLHASGIWRVAFTSEALNKRPDLQLSDGDRVLQRYTPDLSDPNTAVMAYQIVVLRTGLYLTPDRRRTWPMSIIYVEPPVEPNRMAVLTTAVVPSEAPMRIPQGTHGAVIAVLPFGSGRTLQVVATHDSDVNVKPLIVQAYDQVPQSLRSVMSEDSVFVVYGNRPEGLPWFSAVRNSDLAAQ